MGLLTSALKDVASVAGSNDSLRAQGVVKRLTHAADAAARLSSPSGGSPTVSAGDAYLAGGAAPPELNQEAFDQMLGNSQAFKKVKTDVGAINTKMDSFAVSQQASEDRLLAAINGSRSTPPPPPDGGAGIRVAMSGSLVDPIAKLFEDAANDDFAAPLDDEVITKLIPHYCVVDKPLVNMAMHKYLMGPNILHIGASNEKGRIAEIAADPLATIPFDKWWERVATAKHRSAWLKKFKTPVFGMDAALVDGLGDVRELSPLMLGYLIRQGHVPNIPSFGVHQVLSTTAAAPAWA
jgi:hypothetical protein